MGELRGLLYYRAIRKFGLRNTFALSALVLAQGSPVGFVFFDYLFHNIHGHQSVAEHFRHLTHTDWTTLLYIWIGTSVMFSFFGGVCGELADRILARASALRQAHARLRLQSDGVVPASEWTTEAFDEIVGQVYDHLKELHPKSRLDWKMHSLQGTRFSPVHGNHALLKACIAGTFDQIFGLNDRCRLVVEVEELEGNELIRRYRAQCADIVRLNPRHRYIGVRIGAEGTQVRLPSDAQSKFRSLEIAESHGGAAWWSATETRVSWQFFLPAAETKRLQQVA